MLLQFYSLEKGSSARFIKPISFKETDDYLNRNQIYCGESLDKEQFILGSLDGLIVIDKNGSIIREQVEFFQS